MAPTQHRIRPRVQYVLIAGVNKPCPFQLRDIPAEPGAGSLPELSSDQCRVSVCLGCSSGFSDGWVLSLDVCVCLSLSARRFHH